MQGRGSRLGVGREHPEARAAQQEDDHVLGRARAPDFHAERREVLLTRGGKLGKARWEKGKVCERKVWEARRT